LKGKTSLAAGAGLPAAAWAALAALATPAIDVRASRPQSRRTILRAYTLLSLLSVRNFCAGSGAYKL
jgi:hypothetical protein